MELRENERIDELHRNGYRIIQNSKKFCFGMVIIRMDLGFKLDQFKIEFAEYFVNGLAYVFIVSVITLWRVERYARGEEEK